MPIPTSKPRCWRVICASCRTIKPWSNSPAIRSADLAIAILAGFNWLVQCAVQAGADPKEFLGALRNFRKVASSAQKWWAMDGAKERYAEMLAAKQEPPLFFNLVWTDYTRMANEIAAARVAKR